MKNERDFESVRGEKKRVAEKDKKREDKDKDQEGENIAHLSFWQGVRIFIDAWHLAWLGAARQIV